MQLLNIAVVCFLAGYVNGIEEAAVDDLCSLPVVVGHCRAAFPRWFYNSTSQRCESFTYGGCGGNANRFETRELCESACQCDRCTLQRDPGPCRASFPSYFYNVTSEACEKFTYGGCQGNENRFSSEDDCIAQCTDNDTCPFHGQTFSFCRRCTGTCDNPFVRCPAICQLGCSCPGSQVVDMEAQKCVDISQCPVDCSKVDCPELDCVNDPVTPPGSCCPVCGCPNGNGTFILPGEQTMRDCNKCVCTSTGSLLCTLIACEVPVIKPTGETTTQPPSTQRCSIEGQIYMSCGTACPLTCANPEPVACTRQCVAECQCPRGTVLDEDNMRCVRPQFCPHPNETCDICSLQPETGLCKAYFPSYYWNVVTRQCEQFVYGGCGGNLNRFSDIESCRNQCACTSVNCPKGSQCKVYQPTGETFCEPSCDLDNGGCADNETCSLNNVTCVRAPCPPVVECQSCDIKGQEFTSCGTACPPTCSNPNPRTCTLQCVIGCQCPRGTVLDEEQNECVRPNQCSSNMTCDIEGQQFNSCGSACPPTCSNPNPICTRQCVPGCQCPRGTVLDEEQNECVRPNQCRSNMTCDIEGQQFNSCGSACPPTCSNPNPICTRQCVPGCQCPRRTVLDEVRNKCVRLNQCKCPPTCSHEYCSVRSNRRKPCSRPPPHTIPTCPDQCRTTQCNACYYSMNSLETPSSCDRRACTGRRFTRCLRNWASCVERINRRRNRCRGDCITDDNFRCYDYPPCDNLRG